MTFSKQRNLGRSGGKKRLSSVTGSQPQSDRGKASGAFKIVPIERQTFQEQSYYKIREALMKGRFEPGETVSLRSLASELGTSPMPIREAVRHLIAERALELRHNRAFVVPVMTRAKLEDLRKVRIILEGAVAEEAGYVIDDDQIEELAALQDEMRSAIRRKDAKRYLIRNQDFHFSLYRCAKMASAMSIIETLWLQIGPSLNILIAGAEYPPHASEMLLIHHDALLQAVAKKNGKAARAAIEGDINHGMKLLIEQTQE